MKETKEINPVYGLTLGFVNDYPLIGYSTPDIFIEAGAQNINGETSAMILAGGIVQTPGLTLPKYARARVGIALNPGRSGKPSVGLFAGLEKSIDERVVLSANAGIYFGNNCFAYPAASAGAKVTI